jgi:hypothetical protein
MFQLDQPSGNRCAGSDASWSGASEWRTTQSTGAMIAIFAALAAATVSFVQFFRLLPNWR